MKNAKIVLTRIDNRLVHGQVGVTWATSIDIDTIVVIDDSAIYNTISCDLMKSIANAASKKIRFYNVDDFAKSYFENESQQKLFIVVSTPITVMRLVEKNIPIQSVNVGNMHYQRGKVPFNRKMYVDSNEIDAFNYLASRNIDVYYQDVPGTSIEKIPYLVYEQMKTRR